MSSRYRLARALGKEEFDLAVKEDEALLAEFGLRLLYADAGIRAAVEAEVKGKKINPWNVMEVDGKVWEWLRPLLAELQECRQAACAAQTRLAAK